MQNLQLFLPIQDFGYWLEIKDGNPLAREIFYRHYSYRPYRDGRKPKLFCGPGEKMVLIIPSGNALFVWRKFKSANNQEGINCAIFRMELKDKLLISAKIISTKTGIPLDECLKERIKKNRWCNTCRKWEPERYFLMRNGRLASCCLAYRKQEDGVEFKQWTQADAIKYDKLYNIMNTALLMMDALKIKEKSRIKETLNQLNQQILEFKNMEGVRS